MIMLQAIRHRAVFRAATIILLSSVLGACSHLQPDDCDDIPPHSPLVVFGDSYSDMGNISIKGSIKMPEPPFFQGSRFSNGKVAVEWLAESRGITLKPSLHTISCKTGYNFAVGGGNIRGLKTQDLECQVNDYLKMVNDTADPSALFVVMMGGNDIRSLQNDLDADEPGKDIDRILDQLFEQLQRLVAAGASKFLIANSGDMARLPGIIAQQNIGITQRMTDYSIAYNNRFNTKLSDFDALPGTATVVKFDLFKVMNEIIDDAASLGFINATEACFDIDGNPLYHPDCSPANPLSLPAPEIDKFVFLDSVHATGESQRLIGDAMILVAP